MASFGGGGGGGGDVGFVWTKAPGAELIPGVERFARDLRDGVRDELTLLAADVESAARAGAPWNDVTGAARNGLTGSVEQQGDLTILALEHGVDYGIWLEVKFGGRDAIIMPTLQSYYGRIQAAMQRLVGG